ncbi:uncharacterized protein LOC111863852 [Cryptotermes secundus]|uniref:uncharacterized protein LOC111863852 n=1 Tax=Cryptotermes secundus TaxID=105785 RepID=UPI000CD7DAEA|nr:uncharacterized protein LOC111863852 [Cryptotermes secundus]XP_023706367.1 uncharacterized protein LOC111863852 [Cryptotermes secundus]
MDRNYYQQQHQTGSRPWLTKTPAPNDPWQSTTHATYTPPRNDLMKREGRRKLLLERCLYQEMDEAMTSEMSKPNPIEEYKTEYGEAIGVPNFVPSMDNIPNDSKLHKKYPLHRGAPRSFYQDDRGHLVGLTPAADPLAIFKKNSAFTKPLHEILDNHITLL